MRNTRLRAAVAVLASAGLLAGAASALAAHPKKGAHFSGSFAFTGVNGFKPPVSFTVSKDGKKLLRFTYSTLGCFGAGGFKAGVNYYTRADAIIKVGTVKVSASGHFSATGVAYKYTSPFGFATTTTTTLSGHFTKSKVATGSVAFSQKLSGSANSTCSTTPTSALTFTAKA